MLLNRREFLARTGQAGTALTLGSYVLTQASHHKDSSLTLTQDQTFPGKEDMIVQSATVPLL